MTTREERAAQNEALFRRINDRVGELTPDVETLAIVCECADVSCIEQIPGVPRRLYESVRAHRDRFLVLPGHEQPEVEYVVEARPGVLVVAKPAAA